MKAILILADAGQAAEGKINALGAGWSVIGSPTPPMALLVFIDCPWDQTNVKHAFTIDLVDADGHPVNVGQGPLGEPVHLQLGGEFETGRPPGTPPGTPLRQSMAVNVGPGIPLTPGQKYEFRLTIDGETTDSWLASFTVRPNPPAFMPNA